MLPLPKEMPALRPRHLAAIRVAPNANGALDALYVLAGDAIEAPVEGIDGLAGDVTRVRTGNRALRIFHFNDLHNALQVTGSNGVARPLFSRIVRRYREARAVAAAGETVLLLSGGDDHTGTPFDELLGWSAAEFVADPAYVAYSAAGVDAATLGNHDLDRGGAVLAAGIEANASFPILSANVGGSTSLLANRHYFPGAILVVNDLRIGMIGLTTPVDTRIGTATDPGLQVTSPLQALRHMLPAVAARADIVIVMSHCGYGVDSREVRPPFGAGFLAEGDVAIARLAAALTERPVLVLGGHSHTVLNAAGLGGESLIDGVPIVQAGGQGSHVGEFEATLAVDSTRAHWSFDARLHPLAGSPRGPSSRESAGGSSGVDSARADADDEFDREVIAPLLARVRERSEEVLAEIDAGGDLSRETTLSARYCGECALINFICDALVARSVEFPGGAVQLAIVNSTAVADGVPATGALTFSDWYRVQPFADTLQVAEITADELLAILSSNAQRIVRPDELDGPGAIDYRGYVSRGFLHFSGALRYALRLNGSARDAAVEAVMLEGQPLAAAGNRKIRIVITNYLGAGVPGFLPGYDLREIERRDTGLVFRNEVIAHLRDIRRLGPAQGAKLDARLAVR